MVRGAAGRRKVRKEHVSPFLPPCTNVASAFDWLAVSSSATVFVVICMSVNCIRARSGLRTDLFIAAAKCYLTLKLFAFTQQTCIGHTVFVPF